MQVKVEGIEADLRNNGITVRIADNDGRSIGRLQMGKAKLRWWKGKASKNHADIPMAEFVDWLDSK